MPDNTRTAEARTSAEDLARNVLVDSGQTLGREHAMAVMAAAIETARRHAPVRMAPTGPYECRACRVRLESDEGCAVWRALSPPLLATGVVAERELRP